MQVFSTIILRVTVSILLLYFGFSQVLSPEQWIDYIDFPFLQMFNPVYIVLLNGAMELFFAILIFAGVYLPLASMLMGLHVLFIAVLIGVTPTDVRDFAIAGAFFALASISMQRAQLQPVK